MQPKANGEGCRMRRTTLVAVIATAGLFIVGVATPASALTVTRTTTTITSHVRWPCPGADPVEHYTLVFRDTTYERDGVRTKMISHYTWRGVITSRTTGAPIRDNGTWNQVFSFNASGKRVVRTVTTGAMWRLTIPGHGMVVQQTGRMVQEGNHTWPTPQGGFADPTPMCPHV
jgi:hypothetical protein